MWYHKIYNTCNHDKLEAYIYAVLVGLSSLVLWTTIFLLPGCVSVQPVITEDQGVVIDIGDDWVEVSYKVVNRPIDTRVRNIYQKRCGHYYRISDLYPDPLKEREPCHEQDPHFFPGTNVKM
ncbi:hypothetical protein [Mongoliitalea lutea]|uniref:Uncharacterized protein n=1 Tax=Mongoliitalea lutea TaxID=849756 RepID=A0A8J3CYI8_9BACT|nr:hypothetical protein [Mongoliitalea lutea]GHB44595.1 hypothetical protein GCM10008106_27090 [Mongoliitalea lutea]